MTADTDTLLAALTSSHDRLVSAVKPLSPEQLTAPAYPSEWSIAQVLSHLGSGAEIMSAFVTSGLTGEPVPARNEFLAIWDVWNAKAPRDQAADGLRADAALLDQFRATTPEQRASFSIEMHGGREGLAGVLGTRLNEHAVHTWDVVVALDPTATLAHDATLVMLGDLARMVLRGGKPSEVDQLVDVETTDPQRSFGLHLSATGPTVSEDAPDGADAALRLPAEALVRLVYGRLDPEHTPAGVQADGVDLAALRLTFPGF